MASNQFDRFQEMDGIIKSQSGKEMAIIKSKQKQEIVESHDCAHPFIVLQEGNYFDFI